MCRYKDIFGKPGTGIHARRFLGLAVWDVVMTLVGAIVFAKGFKLPMVHTVLAFFVFGIVMHRLFCVRTTIDTLLFTKDSRS